MMNDNNDDSMRATMVMQRADIDDTQQIPISFEDDDNPLYEQPHAAYGSGNNIPPLADNYDVNTNDNKARKPMLKRPIFWIVFLIIMFSMLATMHPFTTTHTKNAPASTSNTTTSTTTTTKPAPVDELTKRAKAFDWDSLKGQKLSNAYQIMKYNQIDPLKMDISIVTDTGEHAIIQSNWTVDSVDYDGNKHILFHVTKDKNASSLPSLNKNDDSNANNDNTDNNNKGSDSGIDTSRINDTLTKGYNTVKGALSDYFNKVSSSSSPGIKIMTYKPAIN